MIVWSIAKEYAKTFLDITLKFPEEEAGWRRLLKEQGIFPSWEQECDEL
ncbi:MAG: hypothetical protein GPJ52_07745 [Candidatus Heimdallarchaeota archaeon]|nr:hypothetical protein [Candidatus Heimdallarchaeota archaeon]